MSHVGMKTILIVDDSDFLLFCFAEYLTSCGFFVETARSVDEAIRKLKTLHLDLIVLEIGIGEIAGVGFLKQLLGPTGQLMWPVLVHTVRPEMEEFCRTIGVEDFMVKTGYGAPLLEGIRAVFARRASAVVEAEPEPDPQPSRGLVLLGEDESALADTMVRAFSRSGFRVIVVSSGPALLEKAESERPLAIVLKEILSGLNGRTVAARLAEAESLCRIPVVIYDNTRGLDEALRWQKVPRNVKSVLFTHEAALLIDAVEKSAHLKAG